MTNHENDEWREKLYTREQALKMAAGQIQRYVNTLNKEGKLDPYTQTAARKFIGYFNSQK